MCWPYYIGICDHRLKKTSHPVCSAISKLRVAELLYIVLHMVQMYFFTHVEGNVNIHSDAERRSLHRRTSTNYRLTTVRNKAVSRWSSKDRWLSVNAKALNDLNSIAIILRAMND